jgi:hypothetical protein
VRFSARSAENRTPENRHETNDKMKMSILSFCQLANRSAIAG